MPTRSSHIQKHGQRSKVTASKASHGRPHSPKSNMRKLSGADVSLIPFDPSTGTDTEECFLPLLLLLGLWSGARGLRGAGRGFGGFGGSGGFGGFGGFGGSGGPGMGFFGRPRLGFGGSGAGSPGSGAPGSGGPWGFPWSGFGLPGRRSTPPDGPAGPGAGRFGGLGGLGGLGGAGRNPFWF